MHDTALHICTLDAAVIHNGSRLAISDSLELSCDDGAVSWTASIPVDEAHDFARLAVGDAITLMLGTQSVALMIDALQHRRDDSPSYQISAISPVARMGAPYAAATRLGKSRLARTACQRLLGQSIDWQIPNWRLPEAAEELEDTPLALAQQIVAVAGGRLESRLDGSLIARPASRYAVPDYASAESVTLSDESLYAYSAQIDAPLIANRFVITSGDDAANADADQIHVESIVDPEDPSTYTVRAYPTPWRPVDLAHTGDSATAIGARADVQTAHTELLEIVAGAARARYPVQNVTSTRWQHVDLGAVRVADPQTLAAGDSSSYSLLEIAYQARAWEWRVTNARAETIQFLAIE